MVYPHQFQVIVQGVEGVSYTVDVHQLDPRVSPDAAEYLHLTSSGRDSMLLHRNQVEAVRDALTLWLERQPVVES